MTGTLATLFVQPGQRMNVVRARPTSGHEGVAKFIRATEKTQIVNLPARVAARRF